MAIPGLRPVFDVRAKIRIGEKRKSADGKKEFPASVDYFICDDAEFRSVVGEKKSELRIYFPFASADDNFSTGLEAWQGKLLTCYSKGEELDGKHVALRVATMEKNGQKVDLLRGFNVLSQEPVGRDRRKVECLVRDCPILKAKDCKPMGRLQFFIEGIGREQGVFQIETKGWNSVEALMAQLSLYPDLRGIPFFLRVAFEQRGRDRFPVLSLEADVKIKNEADIALADALVQLSKAVAGEAAGEEWPVNARLADVLDLTNPGWRDDDVVIGWVRERGVVSAAESILNRHLK